MVVINSPPPDPQISIQPVVKVLPPQTRLLRIFNPNKHNTQATTFRYFGPIGRFDHQRHPLTKPKVDMERGINYWGFSLSCCIVEVFGDTRIIETGDLEVALVELNESIELLDLRGVAAMKAGTVSAIAKTANRDLSQAWADYFYSQVNIYGDMAGLLFSNAHNDEDAIALFERAKPHLESSKVTTLKLNSQALRTAIVDIAIENSLIFLD